MASGWVFVSIAAMVLKEASKEPRNGWNMEPVEKCSRNYGDVKEGQISRVSLQKHDSGESQEQPDQLISNQSEETPQSGSQNQLSQLCTPCDSNSHKDQIHEQEPPSQPQKVWLLKGWQWRCPLRGKGNVNRLKHVQGQVSPGTPQSHTQRSSELENQIQPDQIHEQVLPNQPHLYPNLPDEMDRVGLTNQPHALQTCAGGNHKTPVCEHENDSPMQSHTSTLSELKENDQTEKTFKQETQDQNSSTQDIQNTRDTALEQLVPNPPSELKENDQTEKTFEQETLDQNSSTQDIQNTRDTALEQLVPNPPNSCQESEGENQLKQEQKQEPPTQKNALQSVEHEKQNCTEQAILEQMLLNAPQLQLDSDSENQSKHVHEQNPPNGKQNGRVQALLGNLPKTPPSASLDTELENQLEQVQEEKPANERHRMKSGKQNKRERAREQLPSNPPNPSQNSAVEGQLNEQKPPPQPNGWQSTELEKQTQPQQTGEARELKNGQELQCQGKPESASRQAGLLKQQPVEGQSREPVKPLGPSELSLSIPGWTPMPHPDTTVHAETLSPDSSEYHTVINQIEAAHGKLSVQKIERVQNPELYQSYMLRKQKMDQDNGEIQNERILFHGASHKSMLAIKTHGFHRDSCSVQKKAYGRGLYFTRDAFYAIGYAGNSDGDDICYLYLTRVLVGKYCQGKASMILPPPKQPSIPETLFESVVDNTEDPNIFVVFYGNQCYPEYLATLQRVDL